MRISDWSSDVCSSDLHAIARHLLQAANGMAQGIARGAFGASENVFPVAIEHADMDMGATASLIGERLGHEAGEHALLFRHRLNSVLEVRLEERRVGKEGVRTGRTRWSTYH